MVLEDIKVTAGKASQKKEKLDLTLSFKEKLPSLSSIKNLNWKSIIEALKGTLTHLFGYVLYKNRKKCYFK